MEIKGDQIWHSPSPAELLAAAGQEINLKACVHNIRELGGIAFVVLRTGRYLIQSVYDKEVCPDNNLSQLSAGDCVRATGLLRAEPRAENGVELLIHIGIDTVKLEGRYFTAHVKEGDMVKIGDLLVEFDPRAVTEEGYDTTITLLITNSQEFLDVLPAKAGPIKAGQTIRTVV